ncbi:hypothetical protein H112_04597 [Trichophyton rubrum D6]|uniref:Uncharacterized protein n=3 Tax=Trichophyton TaxID=5550 RepID=F2SN54_TRIRC|nr:uncharacterized protein TERG_04367 [Trichophyton rubrum CBS 118892]EZF22535.1 hypothetical protein H100_04604 [Trichophyton rubrum MR850]EZF41578.1 hypothetical protein H102_04591 [Trichophyton rubrum CBS 100081]EZF52172.1 hypothetical protein H103_04598 [Trichophyton rubrum CBS 288.86]EZF62850.1 hypothetical protein H104_04586 [Trichophyton rubrum CBS 289.86]EZF73559.1 hypothetical protein H105_04614 [Trichophyton soudanense CBS 452.61]EZF84143.1 hypothetical protein H110_04592 [Trichophy
MPVTTRRISREQEQEGLRPPFDDEVSECVQLYPHPRRDQAYVGVMDIVGEDGSGSAPCIQTTDLDSITHGSRKPMHEFDSPFLGWTEDQVRDWVIKHRHPNFAYLHLQSLINEQLI